MRDIKVTISKHSADVEYLIKMLSELFLYKKNGRCANNDQ